MISAAAAELCIAPFRLDFNCLLLKAPDKILYDPFVITALIKIHVKSPISSFLERGKLSIYISVFMKIIAFDLVFMFYPHTTLFNMSS